MNSIAETALIMTYMRRVTIVTNPKFANIALMAMKNVKFAKKKLAESVTKSSVKNIVILAKTLVLATTACRFVIIATTVNSVNVVCCVAKTVATSSATNVLLAVANVTNGK